MLMNYLSFFNDYFDNDDLFDHIISFYFCSLKNISKMICFYYLSSYFFKMRFKRSACR